MYHSVMNKREIISPKEFKNLRYEQEEEQEKFLQNATKRINTCLLEIAGGETPSPYHGRFKHYPKEFADYVEFLKGDYARETYKLIPGMIHIEVCRVTCIAPLSLFETLRQKLIDAGWGEATVIHQRSGEDMVWASLEQIDEEEDFPEIPAEFFPNSKTDSELHTAVVTYGLMPHEAMARKIDRHTLIKSLEHAKQMQQADPKQEQEDEEEDEADDYPTQKEIENFDQEQVVAWCKRLGINYKDGAKQLFPMRKMKSRIIVRINDLRAQAVEV